MERINWDYATKIASFPMNFLENWDTIDFDTVVLILAKNGVILILSYHFLISG
jgi:hypothetical protein